MEAVAKFHGSSEVLKILTPPPLVVQLRAFGEMAEGMLADFTLWMGPFPIHWKARHEAVSRTGFVDVQVEGPMQHWRHTHTFIQLEDEQVEVHDQIEYEFHSGWTGLWTRLLFSRLALKPLFIYRAWQTRRMISKLNLA